jgi:hypothetical protein
VAHKYDLLVELNERQVQFAENGQLSLVVVDFIVEIEKQIAELKAEQEAYRELLTEWMGTNGVEKIDNDKLSIAYIPEGSKVSLDSKVVREKYEEVYQECVRKSTVKPYIKITLK